MSSVVELLSFDSGMNSEFIDDMAVESPLGSVANLEAELDRAFEDLEASDMHHSDGFDGFEQVPDHEDFRVEDQALDADFESVRANPFAVDGSEADSCRYMEPQPKSEAKRKFDSFATMDGHSFQSMASSGSTDFLVFDETLRAERKDVTTPWDSFWRTTSVTSAFIGRSLPTVGRMEASLSLVGTQSERATRPSTLARRRLKSCEACHER